MASQSQALPSEKKVSSSTNNQLNHSLLPKKKECDCCEDSLCNPLFILGVILLLVVGFALFYPSDSYYTPIGAPDSIQVDVVTVSSFAISSSSHLTATWNIDFSFEVDFRSLKLINLTAGISLTNDGINICSKDLGSYIVEGAARFNKIRANLVASSVYINREVAESMISEKKRSGFMHFTLNLKSFASKAHFGDTETMVLMKASCEDISIKFSGDSGSGWLYRTPSTCVVNLYSI